ncbi:MAG: hypothetical protein JWP19_831 [Rhodoglobus sp.]|nr:hypothetical protein [Rhodoglobus sp.]
MRVPRECGDESGVRENAEALAHGGAPDLQGCRPRTVDETQEILRGGAHFGAQSALTAESPAFSVPTEPGIGAAEGGRERR